MEYKDLIYELSLVKLWAVTDIQQFCKKNKLTNDQLNELKDIVMEHIDRTILKIDETIEIDKTNAKL